MQRLKVALSPFGNVGLPSGFALGEGDQRQFNQFKLIHRQPVFSGRFFAQINNTLFKAFKVGEHKLCVNRFGIGDGVNDPLNMGNVITFKAPKYMSDGINFANIRQELIAQAFAFGGAANQACNIDKAHSSGNDLRRAGNMGQLVQTIVGHRDVTNIRFNCAKRKIGRLGSSRAGEGIKKGRFANIRQPNNSTTKSHKLPRLVPD